MVPNHGVPFPRMPTFQTSQPGKEKSTLSILWLVVVSLQKVGASQPTIPNIKGNKTCLNHQPVIRTIFNHYNHEFIHHTVPIPTIGDIPVSPSAAAAADTPTKACRRDRRNWSGSTPQMVGGRLRPASQQPLDNPIKFAMKTWSCAASWLEVNIFAYRDF